MDGERSVRRAVEAFPARRRAPPPAPGSSACCSHPVSPSPASFAATAAGPRLMPRAAVGEDRVADNRVPGAGADVHAGLSVVGDDVCRARSGSADGRAVSIDENPVGGVRKRHGPAGVRADAIPLNHRSCRARPEVDAGARVAGNHVPGTGRGPADDRSRHTDDVDAVARIPKGQAACRVEPDRVALDAVPVRGRLHEDTALAVAGNDVARAGRCAADDVAAGAGLKDDATLRVQHRARCPAHSRRCSSRGSGYLSRPPRLRECRRCCCRRRRSGRLAWFRRRSCRTRHSG